jgi:GTP-binding protein
MDPNRKPYHSAHYVISAHRLDQLPPDEGFEVAFAGRSNAGKSSAINALTGQKSLARTSKTPGRTQQIVIFEIDAERRIADLPGYGFARVPEKLKAHWRAVMQRYFEERACLRGVILVMDARHPMKPFDEQMLAWCSASGVPCHVLLTKADKLKRGPARAQLEAVRKMVADDGERVGVELFSSLQKQGVEAVHAVLDRWLGVGAEPASRRLPASVRTPAQRSEGEP